MTTVPAVTTFPNLPEDHYGALVENDMDVRRLQYLVAQVGEAKVRKSAAKGRFQPIYVSVLLKRFRIKVPPCIYAPIAIPFYRTYVLVFPYASKIKVGYSGDWVRRASAFARNELLEELDLDRSVGISFQGQKSVALAAERAVLARFSEQRVKAPAFVRYGAGGHNEWLPLEFYAEVVSVVRAFQSDQLRQLLTLRAAFEYDRLLWRDADVGQRLFPAHTDDIDQEDQ